MLACWPSELLARALAHLPPPDLLQCMRVSVQWHELVRQGTDWERERQRHGLSKYWRGRPLSTGRSDEQDAEADG